MAEPALSALADIARRFDPDLFHAALFAPEPARERLMVLTAFDVELSRAVQRAPGRDEGPLIAAMRLQFWRDRLADARAGGPAVAHEVAEPLHALVAGPLAERAGEAEALVEARARELETPFDAAAWEAWAEARFGSWHRLVLACLGLADDTAASAAGRLAAAGFTLRHAAAMARQGACLIPDLADGDRSALARGEETGGTAAAVRGLVERGRGARRDLSVRRPALGRRAAPAFLALRRAERDLDRLAGGHGLVEAPEPPPGRALAYAWRAASGRW